MFIRLYQSAVTSWRIRVGVTVGLLVALMLLLSACNVAAPSGVSGGTKASTPIKNTQSNPSQPKASQSKGATQTSEGGQVTIAVTWKGPDSGPTFEVAMDTHSVDLDIIDLGQLAVLRTEQGSEVQASGWNAPKGGHHRSGALTFPATTADGKPVIEPNTRSFEIVIRNVAGVPERVLRWTL